MTLRREQWERGRDKFQTSKIRLTMTCQRIVLITGANSGVGYEAIKALIGSEQQYHVLLGSRSADAGETAKEQLQAEVPSSESTIEILQLDIDSDHSIQAAYERIEGSHGRIDVLVNNDGTFGVTQGLQPGAVTDDTRTRVGLCSRHQHDCP